MSTPTHYKTDSGKSILPAHYAGLITASDTTVLDPPTRAVLVGTAGDLKVRFVGGDVIVIPSNIVSSMVELPISVDMIYATGTTASEILVLW